MPLHASYDLQSSHTRSALWITAFGDGTCGRHYQKSNGDSLDRLGLRESVANRSYCWCLKHRPTSRKHCPTFTDFDDRALESLRIWERCLAIVECHFNIARSKVGHVQFIDLTRHFRPWCRILCLVYEICSGLVFLRAQFGISSLHDYLHNPRGDRASS